MLFLFSLINLSFVAFFFLFGRYVESIVFWGLSLFFIVYFSKILSFFIIENKDTGESESGNKYKSALHFFKNLEFFKKSAYYISFLLFYLSLYGVVYGLNIVYAFSSSLKIFEYLSISISLSIIFVFFAFIHKRYETIFLIFRSNSIVFALIYLAVIPFYIFTDTTPSVIFIFNTLLPSITLLSVILFDRFFQEEKRYIFLLLLFYMFFSGWYYTSLIFPETSVWHLFLLTLSFFVCLCTFILPSIRKFSQFIVLSESVWQYMSYILSFFSTLVLIFEPLSGFIFFIFTILLAYDFVMYKIANRFPSYILFLVSLILLYIKTSPIWRAETFVSYCMFIFLLPYVFIGANYIASLRRQADVLALHTLGIAFSVGAIVYYYIQVRTFGDILGLSLFLFFESILLFMSYMQLRK